MANRITPPAASEGKEDIPYLAQFIVPQAFKPSIPQYHQQQRLQQEQQEQQESPALAWAAPHSRFPFSHPLIGAANSNCLTNVVANAALSQSFAPPHEVAQAMMSLMMMRQMENSAAFPQFPVPHPMPQAAFPGSFVVTACETKKDVNGLPTFGPNGDPLLDHRIVPPVNLNGRKMFPCPKPACPKLFRSRGALAYHLNSHARIKPFVCTLPNCGKKFTAKCSLLKHKETQHGRQVKAQLSPGSSSPGFDE